MTDPNGPEASEDASEARGTRITRRQLLGSIGVVAAGAAVGGIAFEAGQQQASDAAQGDGSAPASGTAHVVAFHGEHQAGIVTPAQDRMHTAAFDVVTASAPDLIAMLGAWTRAIERMTAGVPIGAVIGDPALPPVDTGEALGLTAAHLTVTVGFGPTLFEQDGRDRFGIRERRPDALIDLPAFPGDELDPARSGGDIVVQACADDPQVAFHAIRNLTRIGRGVVAARWSQLGFGRTSSTSRSQATPRNLMGFKDGTNNLRGDDTALLRDFVWVGEGDEPAWMRGGTYVVTRRIRMRLEVWDRSSLSDQEGTIGRSKVSGAPLGRAHEFDTVPLTARGPDGGSLIADDAHIRLASPATNDGARLLRRGYSFTDGIDPVTDQLDAGLFFVCFQRDPRTQFVAVQRRLSTDALNEYIVHVGSGIFAVPPGVGPGGFLGETLFGP